MGNGRGPGGSLNRRRWNNLYARKTERMDKSMRGRAMFERKRKEAKGCFVRERNVKAKFDIYERGNRELVKLNLHVKVTD